MIKLILSVIVISFSLSLKLDLIDDYFIYVYIGDSQTKFKLLVDPTYQYTYILNSYQSKTKKNPELEPFLFTNIYGNYSGKWVIDTFYFKEENITIEMKFLDIYYKKRNILNADGVFGLGHYSNTKFNIYYYLNQLPNNCSNNLAIYDKKNKKILICDSEQSTKSNKFYIPLNYDLKEGRGLIDISKINIGLNDKEITIKNEAFVGLIPLLIPTKKATQFIVDNYLKEKDKEIKEKKIKYDEEEIIEISPIKITFVNSQYLYKNLDNKNLNYINSFLNLDEFENYFKINVNKWYIGLTTKDIERVEFDFDKSEVIIFIYSYKYFIIRISLYILIFGFFIISVLNVFHKKKEKNPKNENEQELMDI